VLTVVSATASNGSVSIGSDGSLTYSPNADFYGNDVINYVIEDSFGNQATGTVNVAVEQTVNVVTVTESKSGGGGSMEYVIAMLLLLALLQRQLHWNVQSKFVANRLLKRVTCRLALFAGVLLVAVNTQAVEVGNSGWFLGAQLGNAKTDVSRGEMENILAQNSLDGEITSLDTSDSSYHLFGGYTFDSNISVQLDIIDWGDRELQITGGTNITNLDNYYATVAKIYPETGSAVQLSAAYTLPLQSGFSIAARVGLLSWDSDYQTSAENVSVATSSADGFEVSIGVELQYTLHKDTKLFIAMDTVQLENHRMNSFGVGVRYFLGGQIQ